MNEVLEQSSTENCVLDASKCDNPSQNTDTSVENSCITTKNENINGFSQNFKENVQNSTIFEESFYQDPNDIEHAKDPVSDFSDESSRRNSIKNVNFLSENDDSLLFSRLFPGYSIENIISDEKFKLFARGKEKSISFCSLFADYLTFSEKMRDEAAIRVATSQNNKLSSPGALSSPVSNECDYFSREQVKKMSREEIARNYNKIRESQQKW